MTEKEIRELTIEDMQELEDECTCDPTGLRDFQICKSCKERSDREEIPF